MDKIKDCLGKYTDALAGLCEASIGGDEVELSKKMKILGESLKELNKTLNLTLKAAQPQWQPIESPPNDRRPVLVCNSFATWESCYSAYSGDWLPAHLIRTGKGVPTHWMELPPPPPQQ